MGNDSMLMCQSNVSESTVRRVKGRACKRRAVLKSVRASRVKERVSQSISHDYVSVKLTR